MGNVWGWVVANPTHGLLFAVSCLTVLMVIVGVLDIATDLTAIRMGRWTLTALLWWYDVQLTALFWIASRIFSAWFFGALADVFGSLVSGGPLVFWVCKYGNQTLEAARAGKAFKTPEINTNEPIAAVAAALVFCSGIIICRAIAAWLTPIPITTTADARQAAAARS